MNAPAVVSSREVLHPSNVRGVVIERVDVVRDARGRLVELSYWCQSETGAVVRVTSREIEGGAS